MELYYNPLDKKCKSVTGGISTDEDLTIKVFGKSNEPCSLVLQKDGGEAQYLRMQTTYTGWQITLSFPETGLYFYRFRFGSREAGCGRMRNLEISENAINYQILVYDKNFTTPDWFKGGVMYQIFPDRFYSAGPVSVEEGKWLHRDWNDMPAFRMNENGKVLNNDFFGGNLKGICEKLDYLQSLNVTVLYLNPIFRAYSNHRYDTGDYMQIDPLLGSEEDFSRLVSECNKRGIKIILDGVFNHTGDDSLYFNKYGRYDSVGAYQSKDSKYYAWYNFRHFPDVYDSWWGIDVLPAVNESCPSYIDFITGDNGVLRHWLKYDIGGYRLDVADELPDEFIVRIREAVKGKKPDAIVLGEVWEDASNKIAYSKRRKYFQGAELDSVMNYPLKDAIVNYISTGEAALFRQTVAMLRDNYPKCVLDSLMNLLGTHDTVRILTVFSGVRAYNKEEMSRLKLSKSQKVAAKEKVKAAAVLLFTVFGVPCIYYGDEIGMEGYSDPFCRRTFRWDRMDEDLLEHFRKLSKLRAKMEVFKESEYRELYADSNCVIYERRSDKEVAVVCMNRGCNKFGLRFDGPLYSLFDGKKYCEKYEIKPHSYAVLTNKPIS